MIRRGEEGRIAVLSEMRTLPEALHRPLQERYIELFRVVRDLLPAGAGSATMPCAPHGRTSCCR
jgi:hypothetical protein